jgi:hypothetical protein
MPASLMTFAASFNVISGLTVTTVRFITSLTSTINYLNLSVYKIFMHTHSKPTKRQLKKWENIEKFLEQQFEKYITIQKKNEKDLRYIG